MSSNYQKIMQVVEYAAKNIGDAMQDYDQRIAKLELQFKPEPESCDHIVCFNNGLIIHRDSGQTVMFDQYRPKYCPICGVVLCT
jgi:hypothetical protein